MKGAIIAPAFHHYNDEIAEDFKKRGYNVSLREYYDGSSLSIPRLFQNVVRHGYSFFKPGTSMLGDEEYAFILVIKGDSLSDKFLSILSTKTKKLFLWFYDPVDKFPKVENKFKFYSSVFLFQYSDYDKYRSDLRFHYLPLYHNFTTADRAITNTRPIDFLFVGAITEKRIQILDKFINVFRDKKVVIYGGYGFFKILRYYKILRRNPNLKGVLRFGLVSPCKLKDLYLSSKFGLNVLQENQTGLNMRFFEMYGAGVKQILWCDDLDIMHINADDRAYRIVRNEEELNKIWEWMANTEFYEDRDVEMSLNSRIDYILNVR